VVIKDKAHKCQEGTFVLQVGKRRFAKVSLKAQ